MNLQKIQTNLNTPAQQNINKEETLQIRCPNCKQPIYLKYDKYYSRSNMIWDSDANPDEMLTSELDVNYKIECPYCEYDFTLVQTYKIDKENFEISDY